MLLKNNSLNRKKILLTGHTGFKGTWMSLMLESMNCQVYGMSLPSDNKYVSDEFYRSVQPNVKKEYFGDVSDFSFVYEAIRECKPEIIIHMASHSSLYGSKDLPHHIIQTNMMGVLNVLEASRKVECVKVVIIVTSDKVYLNKDTDILYRENSEQGGDDPYTTSKVIQEYLAECFTASFGESEYFPVVSTVRASNCIGPGDYNASRLMPYLINCYSKGMVPTIRHPDSIRAWQSVIDVDRGYLELASYLYDHTNELAHNIVHSYNIGPGEDGFRTVGELTDLICEEYDGTKYNVGSELDRINHESRVLKLDSSKALRDFGWTSEIDFEKAVRTTAEFYKKMDSEVDCYLHAREYLNI